jgi:hypothetical protein
MVISTTATATVYLSFALPASCLLWWLTRRRILSAIAGSIAAMTVTSLLRYALPCNYWAHANDFIVEPFARFHCLEYPFEALMSLAFHVGVPLLAIMGIDWWFRKPVLPGCCQQCGYDLTANVSGVCPECGTPVPKQAT